MTEPEAIPTQEQPGSDAAIEAGCRCPVLDNGHGWGYITEGQYVISGDCPMHAAPLVAAGRTRRG